jgi:hypothetical protein
MVRGGKSIGNAGGSTLAGAAAHHNARRSEHGTTDTMIPLE